MRYYLHRKEWSDEDMPFYFVQIAPYRYSDENRPSAGYMMWAQAQTLAEISHSGMATSHDVGDRFCVHPPVKKPIGDRLAYLAMANDYGFKEIDAFAPMPKKFSFENGAATVEFEAGKMGIGPTGRDLPGFELAGEDKVFYPATARVNKDCRSITVSSPDVVCPVAVRYGMKNWSEASLFNSFGIPASPFRSDNWR